MNKLNINAKKDSAETKISKNVVIQNLNISGSKLIKDATLVETDISQKIIVVLHDIIMKKPNSIIEIATDRESQITFSKAVLDNREQFLRHDLFNFVDILKMEQRALEAYIVAVLSPSESEV